MPDIIIKTLTPVHIGSGRDLVANTEFIEFIENDERTLTVIDEKKVLDVIGEENLNRWVEIINRKENLKNYLLKRKPDLKPVDIEKRSMFVYGGKISSQTTLKEQLLSAGEYPMIPGSSIKGAIRTAIIEHLINKHTEKAQEIIHRKRKGRKWSLWDFQFIEADILNELLSKTSRVNANKNTLRFLQVGDAIFKYNTMATNIQILNLQNRGWQLKRGTDQLTETIGIDCETKIRMKINRKLLNENIQKREVRSDTSFLKDLETLFKIINTHTQNLLEKEIRLWEEMTEDYPPELLGNYLDNLQTIKSITETCQKNETVLRIGGGTGWDSITGGWAKTNEDLFSEDEWYQLSKFLNKGRDVKYFPKTRKLDEDGDILGFIKLSY